MFKARRIAHLSLTEAHQDFHHLRFFFPSSCFLRPQTERLHGFGIRFQILEVLPVPFTASLLVSVANHQGQ